jgi:hypothetical protein
MVPSKPLYICINGVMLSAGNAPGFPGFGMAFKWPCAKIGANASNSRNRS